MNTEANNLKQTILKRLEAERVEPTSRYWFLCTEYAVWGLWLLAVVIGAVAFAVVEYISMSTFNSFYEATYESRRALLLDALPYIWVMVFVTMTVAAYVNLRHTRHGYRYNFVTIVLSSLLLSILGGAALQWLQFGSWLDYELSERMPIYRSIEDRERELWQRPEEGRLVGRLLSGMPSDMTVQFMDVHDQVWELDVMELRHADLETLMSTGTVRVLGMRTGDGEMFYACGVFPWLFERDLSFRTLSAERQSFVERIYSHKDAKERLEALGLATYGDRETGMCARMPVIPRITETMQ